MVLRGNSPAKIDAQGRIKIPTAHRKVLEEEFGPEFFVTSINGDNVLLYPLSEWEKIEAKLLEPPKMKPAKQKFLRNTSYFGQVATMDRQGRIMIQPHLRESAGIDGEVSVIGNLKFLEVWNHERFKEEIRLQPFTEDDAAALGDFGL